MKLGEMLVRDGRLTEAQLVSALGFQARDGGRLGTVLFEHSMVDLEALTVYLGLELGIPIATGAMLERAKRAAVRLLQPAQAFKHKCVPLVVQDRQFNPDGTFLYPTSGIPGATWIGEYFGDVMLVNGKVWPFLNVEPRMYRFRILNGCNARILSLDIGGSNLWQIGAEGGMWDQPIPVKELVLAPAERADVLVDFSRFPGARLVMKNHNPRKPVATPAPSLEQVMQIRVGTSVSQPGPRTIPSSLPGRKADLPAPVRTRYITLNEIDVDEPTWFLNLDGVHFDEGPVTETPRVGTVEDWVYVNLTADTHPMHMHLVTFQVIGRTPFDVQGYEEANEGPHGVPGGIDPTPFATGPMEPPDPTERGFKDTVKANPGYFTTIRAKFELPLGVSTPQTYVHHCHIVEHEDNEMMRPYRIGPPQPGQPE